MLKIGPQITHNCNCTCCAPNNNIIKHKPSCNCETCSQQKGDSFNKSNINKASLKKALPLGVVAGLTSAGLVIGANTVLNKVLKSNQGLATTIAVGVGIGVANGVINATLTNAARQKEMEYIA